MMLRFVIASVAAYKLFLASPAISAEVLPTYRVIPESAAQIQIISDDFEILRRLPEGFEIVVPLNKTEKFKLLAPDAKLLNPDLHSDLDGATKALNQEDFKKRLVRLKEAFPDLVRIETYGKSKMGREEIVLTTEANPKKQKKALMITAATHGDEIITVEVILGLIEKLLQAYGHDPRLTRMLDELTIYWIPAVCVDSYATRSRYVEGHDPNRDYPWPQRPQHKPATQCIRDLLSFYHSHANIRGTMDFHAAGSMIMYPWAYTKDAPEEDYDQKLDQLTSYMAEANGFAHGRISDVIYVAKGSSADYYYWKSGVVATAIEVSHDLHFAPAQLDPIIEENTESSWRFIESFLAPME